MKIMLALAATALMPLHAQNNIPVTGRDVPSLVPYENALKPIMQKWSIPGAALAITDQGRLIYARGFGFADVENQIPVQPANLFRLASISKTLTGMTILKLADEGKINLDAKILDLLPSLTPIPSMPFDIRMRNITVRMLLQHTGGWNKDVPSDWVLQFSAAAKALGVPYNTLTPDLMCRWAISQRLDLDPGTRYAYSQSGYLILGRLIEKVTGKKYEDSVREKILMPSGAASVKLGHSLLSQREPDEVKYYDYPGATLQVTTPVVPGAIAPTPRQYGNYWVEQAEAYGGWIGNTIDLLKYVNALEGRRGPAILSPAALAQIVLRPLVTPTGEYTGITWRIDTITGGAHWWHSGGAVGTRNILARRQNNRDWVVLMNSRPLDEDTIITEIFNAFAKAETQVTSWPTNDLFADFAGPTLSASAQSLIFNYVAGADKPAAQTLQISAAPTAVNFMVATPAAAWLTVDRLSGTTPATINVTANPAGLLPGTYTTVLTITAPQAANLSRAVPVTFNVASSPGFTAIRNGASLAVTTSAAPDSRILIDATGLAADTIVTVTGGDAVELPATVFNATDTRLDVVVPAQVPLGEASISVTTADGKVLRDKIRISPVSPGLFSASKDGMGAALATVIITDADGNVTTSPAYDCSSGACVTIPIDLGPDTNVVSLQLAVTGVRSQTDASGYGVTIGDQLADVTSIAISPDAPGVDLINVTVPRSLAGLGDLDVVLSVGGATSNALKVTIL